MAENDRLFLVSLLFFRRMLYNSLYFYYQVLHYETQRSYWARGTIPTLVFAWLTTTEGYLWTTVEITGGEFAGEITRDGGGEVEEL